MSLASIVTAIAGVSVTVGGMTPLTYEPSHATRKIQAHYDTAYLPCRVILPFGADFTASGRALTISGTPKQMVWQPVDLLLWESVGQGRGVIDVMPILAAYMDAYSTAIRAKVALATSPTAIVESWTMTPDVYAYGDAQYWGVEVRLVVRESG